MLSRLSEDTLNMEREPCPMVLSHSFYVLCVEICEVLEVTREKLFKNKSTPHGVEGLPTTP